jgi:TPR repeat protein
LYTLLTSLAVILTCASTTLRAQEQKKSPVYRNYEAASIPLVLPSTLDWQLLEAFVLMQKANAGEAPAQHELGIRYLFGKGYPCDTPKAAYWIQKAAQQKMALAQFNYGLLLMNGFGVEWNPFEAFKNFFAAGEKELPEALYVTGLQYAEDFVVPRNWKIAYRLFRKAADLGYNPAKATMKEMVQRGLDTSDTKESVAPGKERPASPAPRSVTPKQNTFNFLFLDFHKDTVTDVPDTTLIREAIETKTMEAPTEVHDSSKVLLDSTARSEFMAIAEAGNPEALCVLGRCYEHGVGVPKNLLLAGVYYIQALHLDSYRAPALLWKLTIKEEFSKELEARTAKKDPEAQYVWAGLTYSGFSKLLNEKQAFEALERSAEKEFVPAMVDLGSCYMSGRWTLMDKEKAVAWWNRAVAKGNTEARIRLAAASIFEQAHALSIDSSLSILRTTAQQGSLYSELALAYCSEKGIGTKQNKGEAYRIFHRSFLRGSETALSALRRMHDEIRPANPEFQFPE